MHWKGYPDTERMWEPASKMREDVLELVEQFHKRNPQAPCRLDINMFLSLPFQKYENLTEIPTKTEKIITLPIKKESSVAHIPSRGSAQSAGLDLYSADTCIVPPHS